MDGCAILFKKSRFVLVEKHALEFNHVAMSRARYPHARVPETLHHKPLNHVAMHACMFVCWYVCMYACMHSRTHARMHACMHVCNIARSETITAV